MTTKPLHGRVDDAVVSPAQQAGREPGGDAHRRLRHLDRPGRVRARFGVVAFERDSCDTLEVAVYRRVDAPCGYAVFEDDLQSHSIRKRRSDDAAYHGSSRQAPPIDTKLAQPLPPRCQRLEPLEHGPYLLGSCSEGERARVVGDVWRLGRLVHGAGWRLIGRASLISSWPLVSLIWLRFMASHCHEIRDGIRVRSL